MKTIRSLLRSLFRFGDNLSSWQAILIIVSLSIGIKLVYIAVLGGGFTSLSREPDGIFYEKAARDLLEYGVYGGNRETPLMQPPPGQAAFLALAYTFSNGSVAMTKLVHVGIVTLVTVLIYLTGSELFSPAVGFWAGILTAVDPAQTYLSGTFLSEPLFTLAMVSGIHLLVVGRRRNDGAWRSILAGVCFAAAGYTRNQGWAYPMVLLFGAFLTRGRMVKVCSAAITLGIAALLIAPWTFRNYRISGEFVIMSTNGGLTLWSANNPEFDWRQPMPMSHSVYAAPEGLSDVEYDQYYRSLALDWIRENPALFLRNAVRKFIVLYNFDPMPQREGSTSLFRIAGLFPYGLLLPFIFLGMIEQVRNQETWIILCFILYTTLLALVFFGDSRIRAPIQPYLYLFAVTWIANRFTTIAGTQKRLPSAQPTQN